MRVRLLPAVGGPVTIGDDAAGLTVTAGLPKQQREVQIARFFRGKYARPIARGNRLTSRPYTVDRLHANEAAATLFMRDHPDQVPDSGKLEITQSGSLTVYDAVVDSVECIEHDGKSTKWRYNFVCGQGRSKL